MEEYKETKQLLAELGNPLEGGLQVNDKSKLMKTMDYDQKKSQPVTES